MKVLMLNGSPHPSGVNDLALCEMEAVFKENGIETEIVQVGNVATFLLSNMSDAITGQVIYADNGYNIMGA